MTASAEIGAKGRLVIPAQVRQEAEVEIGQSLIARAEGVGRIVLETARAVEARVWSAAPVAGDAEYAADDVRLLRDADIRTSDASSLRRASDEATASDPVDDAGRALLRAVGL